MASPSVPFQRRCYEALSFLRHIPNYFRLHVRSAARRYSPPVPGHAIFVDRHTYIISPMSSSITHQTWVHHSSFHTGVFENEIFLKLREGCTQLFDLGAAEGYYAALFANTATKPSRIVAVDLAPFMCRMHQEVISENKPVSGQPIDWTIHQVAMTDHASESTLQEGMGKEMVCWYDDDPERKIRMMTMPQFLEEQAFTPDLIKIDIESYEYEVITSSMEWLVQHKPKLHLELHSEMLRKRGKSPDELMSLLLKHYRVLDAFPRNYQKSPLNRIGLVPL